MTIEPEPNLHEKFEICRSAVERAPERYLSEEIRAVERAAVAFDWFNVPNLRRQIERLYHCIRSGVRETKRRRRRRE